MLVSSLYALKRAKKENYAIPHANMVDQHTVKAEICTAAKLNLPIIIGWAPVHNSVCTMEEAVSLTDFYSNFYNIPVILHLDHGESFEQVKQAIALGFTSVMFDGSSLPYEENIRKTKIIVDYAHKFNISVEAELGHVGDGSCYLTDDVTDKYTKPEQAIDFICETGIDSLAIAIGTAHGEYKGIPKIDYDRLSSIRKVVELPLVLHGSSGTGFNKLEKCVNGGINKINVCTDLLKAGLQYNNDKINYVDSVQTMEKNISECLQQYYKVFHTKQQ